VRALPHYGGARNDLLLAARAFRIVAIKR